VRPKLAAITVTGYRLIPVICIRRELSDLEQVQAERLDLRQHAVPRRPVQQAGKHADEQAIDAGLAAAAPGGYEMIVDFPPPMR
jgi:hypothetical protein